MKLKVDKDLCIGCGACQAVCPEVFEIEDDGLATTIVDEIKEDNVEDAIDADGRGNFISHYDGVENEQDGFYIYRVD
jgi:ferredoxin